MRPDVATVKTETRTHQAVENSLKRQQETASRKPQKRAPKKGALESRFGLPLSSEPCLYPAKKSIESRNSPFFSDVFSRPKGAARSWGALSPDHEHMTGQRKRQADG